MSFPLCFIGLVHIQQRGIRLRFLTGLIGLWAQGGKKLMVASLEASYHSDYTGPGSAPWVVASAVPQSPMLRSVLCLVECSVVIILKFLIIF